MNQLLAQLTTKPSTEIHPVAFVGTAAENILDWLESFNRIAIHNVWNDQKQLQVIPVYLKDTALNFYRSLPDQTKAYVNLLKDALRDRYHTQDRLYDMRVKLHELRQGSLLEMYINDLDTLARHLEFPEQQKIHYFTFGHKPKLKQALLIRQLQTYDDAVTFATWKHHFAYTDSDTQSMDLLQEIRKEVSLEHTGIKQEPYSMPTTFSKTSPNFKRIYKFSRNPLTHPTPNILRLLIPTLLPFSNSYLRWKKTSNTCSRRNALMSTPLLLGTTDGLVICRQCNRAGYFACACPANLSLLIAPTHYQNYWLLHFTPHPGYFRQVIW